MPVPSAKSRDGTLPSACPLDCPDACSLDVVVEGGRAVSLDGNRVNPLTGGFICAKVRGFPERVYGPDRLMYPAVRCGRKGEAEFERVSWEEALERIAIQLTGVRDRRGGEAILPFSYGGSNGFLTHHTTDERLFSRLGASRLARTVCAAPSGSAATGLYGKMPGVALSDYAHSRLIVVWGCNPLASGIHLVPVLYEAQRRGAKLVVVDPRRTKLAERADLHLQIRPGTDLPVALSIIRELFESGAADLEFLATHSSGSEELKLRVAPWNFARAAETAGVPAADLATLAAWYTAASPAAIRCGWGPERNRNGGSAIAAILALPAVAGKFGVRGGGYTMSNSGAWKLDARAAARAEISSTREINMNKLGDALLEANPAVEFLFVYNANPLATIPNQTRVRAGLERDDLFTVVFDQVMTDTARYADVILPSTTFLEHRELVRGYGALVLQAIEPVIPPVGEARPNDAVFGDLCRRTGVRQEGDPETAEDLVAAILGSAGNGEELERALAKDSIAYPAGGNTPIQFVDVHPFTSDRMVHLVPEDLDREAPGGLYHFEADPATAEYPLALISPATDKTISSSLGELNRRQVPVEIHPTDAAPRQIADGDPVRISNAFGEVHCAARLNAALRPGVLFLPKGLWSHNTLNGNTANALAPDSLTDLGAGACFNDARVQIRKL